MAALVLLLAGAAFIWLFSGTAHVQTLEDAPVPAAISLMKANGSLSFYDDEGRSLYISDNDPVGGSACEGECALTWQPVAAPNDAHTIGSWTPIRRTDGGLQWAYKGKPVYTYQGDTQPGQTNGANLDGAWHLLTP